MVENWFINAKNVARRSKRRVGPILTQFWPKIEPWEQKIAIFVENSYPVTESMWKKGLILLSSPIGTFWTFWVYFGPNLTPISQNWYMKTKIWNFYAKFILSAWNWDKNGIIWSFRPIIAFFGHFGPILDQFWPNFDPKLNLESKNLQFLCKIHTQWLKPCEKWSYFSL